jgi:hypothetical protein
MSLLTPDDFEQGSKFLDIAMQAGKWVAGTAAAAWVAFRFSVRAGEQKRRYEELAEDVAQLKLVSTTYLTKPQHDDMQKICQGDIERMIDNKLHKAILEWRDELAALNANICHIMGALKIAPVDQGKRRRRSDTENGD